MAVINSINNACVVADTEEDLASKLEELNKNLISDSRAVNFSKEFSDSFRCESNLSAISVNSEDYQCINHTDSLSVCSLPGDLEKRHTRWPSFTNGFPSFISSAGNSAPFSTLSICQQWDAVINNWDQYSKRKSQVADLFRRGIPDEFRSIAWQLYTGAYDSPLRMKYNECLSETSPFERAIRRDISRTYPKHDFFKKQGCDGQEGLFNVMKAYSIYDREVGYCQGSGFIVGLLLMQMCEESAFAVLVQLMNDYHMRELYKPCMTELGVRMHQLDGLIDEYLPDLHAHFVTQGFAPSLYASAWFLTLFATAFPISMATRVMDMFIAEGMDFILRLSLAILKQFSSRLLSMDMEMMISSLQQTEVTEWEDHGRVLFETALSLKLNQRKLKKLRNEYLTARSQEQGDKLEIRRLRTENGLLLQRVARLEEDNTYLANQLIECNLQRAQFAEEIARLRGDAARWYAKDSTLKLAGVSSFNDLTEGEVTMNHVSVDVLDPKRSPKTSQSATTSPVSDSLQEAESTTSGVTSWASQSFDAVRVSSDQLLLETINQLETDLVHLRVREADTNASLRDAKDKIRQLDEKLSSLSQEPLEKIEVLQEELLRVKLREAESVVHVKELNRRIDEIRCLLDKQTDVNIFSKTETVGGGGGGFLRSGAGLLQSKFRGRSTDIDSHRLSDRLLEAKFLAQISDLGQQVRELSSSEVLARKQADRNNDRVVDLDEKLNQSLLREKSLRAELKEADCRFADLEAKRKSDGLMWRIRELELNSKLAEMRQLYGELDCFHDAQHASNTLQGLTKNGFIQLPPDGTNANDLEVDLCPSTSPPADLHRSSTPGPKMCASETPTVVRRASAVSPSQPPTDRLSAMWKDLPSSIMTDSIGPLEDICIIPDDPMITSIYMDNASALKHK